MILFHQTISLLHKNVRLKRRSCLFTACELACPILVLGGMVAMFWVFYSLVHGLGDLDDCNDETYQIFPTGEPGNGNYTFAPDNNITRGILDYFFKYRIPLVGFPTIEEMKNYSINRMKAGLELYGGVAFNSLGPLNLTGGDLVHEGTDSAAIDYTIFMQPRTNLLPSMQHVVDNGVFRLLSNASRYETSTLNTFYQQMPKYCDDQKHLSSKNIVRGFLFDFVGATWLIFALIFTYYKMVTDLVVEKASRVRESMKMMGMRTSSYWVSWAIWGTFLVTVSALLSFVLLVSSQVVSIYQSMEFFALFILLNASLVPMCFLISTFISYPKLAGPAGCVIILGLSIVGNTVMIAKVPDGVLLGLSVFSPIAFAVGLKRVFSPSNSFDLVKGFTTGGYTSVGFMCMALVVDTLIYYIFTLYFDAIVQGQYGTRQPFYFPILPSYWLGPRWSITRAFQRLRVRHRWRKKRWGSDYASLDEDEPLDALSNADVEPHPLRGVEQPHCSILGLTKKFSNGTRAVDGVYLDIYKGELLSFLGHNGAGKSTTINMLTGMLPPSGGDAIIEGLSIRTDIQRIRRNLGVCPQHDILFNSLTVREHLELYAGLKGLPLWSARRAAREMIAEVDLVEKADSKSKTLSGGQKRRLSIGIALIGGSQLVFLDEPTSGLDPMSRRNIWDLLQRNKADRAIVLTTHFMDEADVLGDRIAVIAKGKIRCAGSSLYLKSKFGVGYLLTMVKNLRGGGLDKEEEEEDGLMGPSPSSSSIALPGRREEREEYVRSQIDCVVKTHLERAEVVSDAGAEVSYRLPKEDVHLFAELFRSLDERRDVVMSYGVSITSLEEVFMSIVREDAESKGRVRHAMEDEEGERHVMEDEEGERHVMEDEEGERHVMEDGVDSAASNDGTGDDGRVSPHIAQSNPVHVESHGGSYPRQMYAFFIKRLLVSRRDYRQFIVGVLLPLLVIIGVPLVIILPYKSFTSSSHHEAHITPPTALYDYVERYVDVSKPRLTPWASPYNSSFTEDVGLDAMQHVQGYSEDLFPRVNETYHQNMTVFLNSKDIRKSRRGAVSAVQWRYTKPLDGYYEYTVLYNESVAESYNQQLRLVTRSINLINQAAMRSHLNDSTLEIRPSYSLLKRGHNNNDNDEDDDDDGGNKDNSTHSRFIMMPVLLFFAFALATASFIPFLVREKNVGAKGLQHAMGLGKVSYWMGNLVYDTTLYFVTVGLGTMIVLVAAWGGDYGESAQAFMVMISTLYLYGWASIPYAYLMSLPFKRPALTAGIVTLVFYIPAFVGMFVVLFETNIHSPTYSKALIVDAVFTIISPLYAGIMPIAKLKGFTGMNNTPRTPLVPRVAGLALPMLALQAAVGIAALLVVEMRTDVAGLLFYRPRAAASRRKRHRRLHQDERMRHGDDGGEEVEDEDVFEVAGERTPLVESTINGGGGGGGGGGVRSRTTPSSSLDGDGDDEEEDVTAERMRVRLDGSEPIQAVGLRKSFGWLRKNVAVANTTLGIASGECFGLLGLNGAGKTTTINMLVGDLRPTSGTALLNGVDILENPRGAQRSVGLCPQFDALLNTLTGREHLRLFARLKGIPRGSMEDTIDSFIEMMDLGEHADKLTSKYSGGNKRKLSLALALIGNPSVVFLDEPSTGMDPVAKRFMWDLICAVRDGRAIVLTTHSMEECEALCTRVGIMKAGRLLCLGSNQHLKHKFGNSYKLEIKLDPTALDPPARDAPIDRAPPSGDILEGEEVAMDEDEGPRGGYTAVQSFILSHFPNASMVDSYGVKTQYYEIPTADTTLADVFELLVSHKDELGIADFGLSQTSLEQIFLDLAGHAAEDLEALEVVAV